MTTDDWVVTSDRARPNGSHVVRGISPTLGPFVVTIPLTEYATMGYHPAVRSYYAHHPHGLGQPR